mmetsp:Transcript_9062/g.8060  ORF Transcript_9062/g.8060 Transcript_9062/m.8060 type:complete len:331 (+) Transcript_9062:277-1269(+)
MYGFHKTRGKNNEQCFIHELFKRDNKKLLLEMKRKVREKQEKKEEETCVKTSDFLKCMKEMKTKIKEQDTKINNLSKQNTEFKQSVMTLYHELEKSKEKEKSSNHLHLNFGAILKGLTNINGGINNFQQKLNSANGESQNSIQNGDMLNIINSLFNGINIQNDTSTSAPVMPIEEDFDKNLMISNKNNSPQAPIIDEEEKTIKKRANKEAQKQMEHSSPNISSSLIKEKVQSGDPNVCLNKEYSQTWSKNNFEEEHSEHSELCFLKDLASDKNELISGIQNSHPFLGDENNLLKLAIKENGESIEVNDEIKRNKVPLSFDSMSSFSANSS